MKNDIIYFDEMHGMMFNSRSIHFNEKNCIKYLNEDLTDESKRELFQTYFLSYFIDYGILSRKTLYGDCDVTITKEIEKTKQFQEAIIQKLKGKFNLEDIYSNYNILASVLKMNDIEKEQNKEILNLTIYDLDLNSEFANFLDNTSSKVNKEQEKEQLFYNLQHKIETIAHEYKQKNKK